MKAAFVTAAIGAVMVATSWAQTSGQVISGQEAADTVVASDVKMTNGKVSAVLANKSSHAVRDVQLLIRHTWYWNNERHPGPDSPGRTDRFIVQDQIPANGSLPFTYSGQPLPGRADGHFKTTIEVIGFTQVG